MSKVLAEWLRKADKDMAVAERLATDEVPFCDAISFHCQQAAEKYLKALLVLYSIEFPKTHDLEILLNLIATKNSGLADGLRDVIVLTPYGVEIRYPGDRPDASVKEAEHAVHLARMVRDAILPLMIPA
ncbi:MAG: HEPN domain-containing protein [Phycisphaerae bacterium]|nr:HEPN domain-containing protein [Phycisphaerae bacterium]